MVEVRLLSSAWRMLRGGTLDEGHPIGQPTGPTAAGRSARSRPTTRAWRPGLSRRRRRVPGRWRGPATTDLAASSTSAPAPACSPRRWVAAGHDVRRGRRLRRHAGRADRTPARGPDARRGVRSRCRCRTARPRRDRRRPGRALVRAGGSLGGVPPGSRGRGGGRSASSGTSRRPPSRGPWSSPPCRPRAAPATQTGGPAGGQPGDRRRLRDGTRSRRRGPPDARWVQPRAARGGRGPLRRAAAT